MKLSLIIPVYNVEQYLEKCLRSCLEQDIPRSDYEIIVINDGSPDGSLAIAKRIASEAENIRIVSQKNGGLSAARNTGLSIAKGDYVWFIDSDDTIKENCLKSIVEQCFSQELDLLAICAANIIGNQAIRRFSYTDKTIVSGIEVLKSGMMQHCAPFTIYRTRLLKENNMEFYIGIYHEDSEWSPRIYFHAQKVGFTNEILYFVTINPISITRSANPRKGFDCLTVARSIDEFYKTHNDRRSHKFFHNHISLMINNALSNFADKSDAKVKEMESEFINRLYEDRYLFAHLRKATILKYKIEGVLFVLFPKRALSIYRSMVKLK